MTKQFPISHEARREITRSQAHRERMDRIRAGDKSAKFSTTPRKATNASIPKWFNENRDIRRFG